MRPTILRGSLPWLRLCAEMPQPLIIFGASSFASMVSYVMAHDSDYEVAAFAVDSAYLRANLHAGKPIVAFEEVETQFPPDSYAMLVPLGGHGDRNDLRASRYLAAKRKGYRFATYVSSRAIVWPDLRIGENSMIFEAAVVQPHASIGNNCILRSQVCVSHHARIGDHCFLAAGAVVGGNADVGARCFLGLNSTVRDGVIVPPACLIGAGASLCRISPPRVPTQAFLRESKRRATPIDRGEKVPVNQQPAAWTHSTLTMDHYFAPARGVSSGASPTWNPRSTRNPTFPHGRD